MSDELAIQPSPDALVAAAGELHARKAWVRERIADACYSPSREGQWAGRDDVVAAAAQKFSIDLIDAGQIVDLVRGDLWAEDKPDDRSVVKQLMILRVTQLRKLILRAIDQGKTETTWKFEDKPDDPKVQIKKLMKEKTTRGIEMAAVGRLLEVEILLAELLGLKGEEVGSSNVLTEIFDELERRGEEKPSGGASVSQRTRAVKVSELNAAGQRSIEVALQETRGQAARKAVKSSPVKGNK